MTAAVLDGAAMAREILSLLRPRVEALGRQGVQPGLATVLVGDHPASRVYVRNKIRACASAGLHSEVHELPADCSQAALLDKVDALNRSSAIHGIIVQLPLPRAISISATGFPTRLLRPMTTA